MIRFTAQSVTVDAAAGEEPTRTISGIAVPYGVEASVSTGQRVRVEAGALPTDGPAPRLLQDHDPTQVIGMVTAREDTPEGMLFSAKIAKTRAGDDLLELLQMGAYDSVSIGIEPTDVEQDGRTTVVKAANWSELSVVYQPAFRGRQDHPDRRIPGCCRPRRTRNTQPVRGGHHHVRPDPRGRGGRRSRGARPGPDLRPGQEVHDAVSVGVHRRRP
jgi:HK97 family phage prohead protease